MKRFLVVFGLLLGSALPLWSADFAWADTDHMVTLHVFERPDCTHCRDLDAFLKKYSNEDKNVRIESHNIYERTNEELFVRVTEAAKLPKVTPVTFIEGYIIQGFEKDETTGKQIRDLIDQIRAKAEYVTLESFLKDPKPKSILDTQFACKDGETSCGTTKPEFNVSVPFFGKIDLLEYSLPALSLILGFVDGFNPCAMWVLVVFLTVLVNTGSRKKMWQVAGLFILAEAVMYYLILNVWFTTWNFVKLDAIVTPIVGIVAVGAGAFFLREWWKGSTECKVTSFETRKKTMNRISALVQAEMTVATILGILLLAFSVNIIEFACSIGIPQAFTKVIELNSVSFAYEQFLMALYILMYMVDDFIVFGIALWSFEKIGLTHKYTNMSHLIGGALMIVLGVLLLFYPEALVFF